MLFVANDGEDSTLSMVRILLSGQRHLLDSGMAWLPLVNLLLNLNPESEPLPVHH